MVHVHSTELVQLAIHIVQFLLVNEDEAWWRDRLLIVVSTFVSALFNSQ